MSKSDNPHSVRLYNSLSKHVNEQTAAKIADKNVLTKSANIDKKFAWAESICADLHDEFDDETVKIIRMDCSCGPEMGKINKLKKLFQSSACLAEFVTKVNKSNQGFTLHNEAEILFLIYPQCYCSCVKRVNKPLSEAWCYCTLGYTKKMFENIFERYVNVELIESVKTGGSKCMIKIT